MLRTRPEASAALGLPVAMANRPMTERVAATITERRDHTVGSETVRAKPAAGVSEEDCRAQDNRADSNKPSEDCLRGQPWGQP